MPVMVVHWICTPDWVVSVRTVMSGSPSWYDPAKTCTSCPRAANPSAIRCGTRVPPEMKFGG